MFAQVVCLLLPVAAACGWYLGSNDRKKTGVSFPFRLRFDYFRGLNYLINEQPDKAVDVFVKLIEVDSETVETHLALGSLFRRRGEVDRAIRIHQNLMARPQLERRYRMQALAELGQDYLRAGVLDRAERLFLELVKFGYEDQHSLSFLINIYQQEKEWAKAIQIARRLESKSGVSMKVVIAQYYCELAEKMREAGSFVDMKNYLKQARVVDANCVRASILQAKLDFNAGKFVDAINDYKKVEFQGADYLPEVMELLCDCYCEVGDEEGLVAYLTDCFLAHQKINLITGVMACSQQNQHCELLTEFIHQQLAASPSLQGLEYQLGSYLQGVDGRDVNALTASLDCIKKLLAAKPAYQCSQCGFAGKTLYWLCPGCQQWTTIKPICLFDFD